MTADSLLGKNRVAVLVSKAGLHPHRPIPDVPEQSLIELDLLGVEVASSPTPPDAER